MKPFPRLQSRFYRANRRDRTGAGEDIFVQPGFCQICEGATVFSASNSWFRDHLVCRVCQSIPRERALMSVIEEAYPSWRELEIHESSPGGRGASVKLMKQCTGYSSSAYLPHTPRGLVDPVSGIRSEDLEELTFESGSFDLFVTQDVLEHVFDPLRTFQEIERVLRPGGAHIFTVPLVKKFEPTVVRASRGSNGDIIVTGEPEYHGNPFDASGSLVTMDWGYDIASAISSTTSMETIIIRMDDVERGLRAAYLEVLVSRKDGSHQLHSPLGRS